LARFNFPLPDVGEGLTEAEIVSWRVAPGDSVSVNQVVCEIETAKSLVELPSPFEGVVAELLAQEGETVVVGTPIISVDDLASEVQSAGEIDPLGSADEEQETKSSEPKNLVGYTYGGESAADEVKSRRRRKKKQFSESSDSPVEVQEAVSQTVGPGAVLAKPPVRKLAKDLGLELRTITGSGNGGEILRDDLNKNAGQSMVFRNTETPEWPENREDRIPVKGVRKAIAQAMVKSMFSAPHVSVFVDVDATRTMEFVRRLRESPDFAGIKISPLLVMVKAMIWAVQRNPTVNSTWTEEEIIVHHYVNVGVAAATPRGLIVPNIKEAQTLGVRDLAIALENLTLTAREGRTAPEEMSGGTITITNLGSFGVDTGTPILNPGEVTIVALGTIKPKPWVVNGEVLSRMVTTVAASFDHRVVDGDVASKFVADVASVIEEPALLLD